eukprot:superscaffoldBa00000600_g5972
MWRLSDPTAMAAPSLYASLQRPSDGKSAFFCDFSGSAVNPNLPLPPSNFGVLTEAPGRRALRKMMVLSCSCREAPLQKMQNEHEVVQRYF